MRREIKEKLKNEKESVFTGEVDCGFSGGKKHYVSARFMGRQLIDVNTSCDALNLEDEVLESAGALTSKCCIAIKTKFLEAYKMYYVSDASTEGFPNALILSCRYDSFEKTKIKETDRYAQTKLSNSYSRLNVIERYARLAAVSTDFCYADITFNPDYGLGVCIRKSENLAHKMNGEWNIKWDTIDKVSKHIKLSGYEQKVCTICKKYYANIAQHIKSDAHAFAFGRNIAKIVRVIGVNGLNLESAHKRTKEWSLTELLRSESSGGAIFFERYCRDKETVKSLRSPQNRILEFDLRTKIHPYMK